MNAFVKKFIGTRAFYASVLTMLVPMIVQQGITQFVNLLDNVMVGRLGTAPMSGVAIVNQIIFIFNLTIFGGLSGASIFGAQFYGKGDHQGLRYTLRFRLVFSVVLSLLLLLTMYLSLVVVITGDWFLHLLEEGYFDGEENILFLHSGGAGGLFAVELPE